MSRTAVRALSSTRSLVHVPSSRVEESSETYVTVRAPALPRESFSASLIALTMSCERSRSGPCSGRLEYSVTVRLPDCGPPSSGLSFPQAASASASPAKTQARTARRPRIRWLLPAGKVRLEHASGGREGDDHGRHHEAVDGLD